VGTPYHFHSSTPTIAVAGTSVWPPPGRACLVIAFATDIGEVTLQFFP